MLRRLAFVGCAVALACGDSRRPPTAFPTVSQVQIHIVGGYLKVGNSRGATATVVLSDGTSQSVQPQWDSTNTAVFTISERGLMTGVSAGLARVRATYMNASNEIDIRVVSVVPPPAPASSAGAGIVISELRSRGGLGENDEFVEIHNVGGAPIDISGWSIAVSDRTSAATSGNVPAGTILPGGCFYLLTGAGINAYSDGNIAIGDFLYDAMLDDDGGVALVDASGVIMDQVGFSRGTRYVEGTPISNPNGGNHERVGDTDDNSRDFRQPGGIPESSRSSCRS